MMNRTRHWLRMIAAIASALILCLTGAYRIALAHGHVVAGDYEIEIGFHNEPAYVGEPNSLDLFVTNTKTNEAVEGLEDTLKAEIIYGSSKREVPLRPQGEESPGYTADVLPTKAGDYTWHVWGDIEGTPVDITMTSSPDTFGSVEEKTDAAFPAPETSSADLQQQIRITQIIAGAGIVLGLAGVILGLTGRRKTV
jgi:hypothetical protein